MPFDLKLMRNDLQISDPVNRVSLNNKLQIEEKPHILPQLKNLKLESNKNLLETINPEIDVE